MVSYLWNAASLERVSRWTLKQIHTLYNCSEDQAFNETDYNSSCF